ncbi:hypothetical protein MHYP_G00142900 [Metynnis hypsauchen]
MAVAPSMPPGVFLAGTGVEEISQDMDSLRNVTIVIFNYSGKYILANPRPSSPLSPVLCLDYFLQLWIFSNKASCTPFVQEALNQMSMALGIVMRKHCSYHPASAGVVERAKSTIKSGLDKMTQSTGNLRQTRWNQPRWMGPLQVLLVTHTAVKVEGRAVWVNHTHCKKAPVEDQACDSGN